MERIQTTKSSDKYIRGIMIYGRNHNVETGMVHLFKKLTQDNPTRSLSLSGGRVNEQSHRMLRDPETNQMVDSFEFKLVNKIFIVVAEQDGDIKDIQLGFESASQLPKPKSQMASKIGNGVYQIMRVPWRLTSLVVVSLEKIGQGAKATPNAIMMQKSEKTINKQPPSNIASGLASGSKLMIGSLFSALAGVVIEPVIGGKKQGVKGVAIGIGKGVLGLVFKPISGTIDLVTHTTRGISNTPKYVYLGMKKIVKRKPRKRKIIFEYPSIQPFIPNEKDIQYTKKQAIQLDCIMEDYLEDYDDIKIGYDDTDDIYLDIKLIQEHLMNEEAKDIGDIITRQIDVLSKRDIQWKQSQLTECLNMTEQLLMLVSKQEDNQEVIKEISEISSHLAQQNSEDIEQSLKKILKLLRDQRLADYDDIEEFDQNEEHGFMEVLKQNIDNDAEVYLIHAEQVEDANDDDDFSSDDDAEEEFALKIKKLRKQNVKPGGNRNPMYRRPPTIHSHQARNPLKRTFTEEENKQYQDILIGEYYQERLHSGLMQHKKDQKQKPQEVVVIDPNEKKKNQILEICKNWQPSQRTGDYKIQDAAASGGFELRDKRVMAQYRSAGKEMIKVVGKKILSGQFNLTTVSFPIKCMCASTILQAVASVCASNPLFMNIAAISTDPIERMKHVITASISHISMTHMFSKPLNPILGETYCAKLADGTMIYAEQTAHKPPISHCQFIGPDDLYQMDLYTGFHVKASFNSIQCNVLGRKRVVFKDGTIITFNNPSDIFANTFFGTIKHELIGKIEYQDEKNSIIATLEINSVKGKAQDFFSGVIRKDGVKVCDIYGNYLGFLDFGKDRYWDARDSMVFQMEPIEEWPMRLESDSRARADLQALEAGDIEHAQEQKEVLENLQRGDAKLRHG